jgi:hypothetical protein
VATLKIEVIVEGVPAATVNPAKSDLKKIWKKLGWSFVSSKVSDRRELIENGKTIEKIVKLSMVFTKKIRDE